MRIIIAGAGEVGTYLAKMLAHEHLEITLIDNDATKLSNLESKYDLLTFEGSATSIDALSEAKVKDVDLFIALTTNESVNMTACMIAHRLGALRTLARIDNYEYLLPENRVFFQHLGIDYLINPETLAAGEIVEALKTNTLRQHMSFCNNALMLVGIKVRSNAIIINKKFISGYFNHSKYRIVAIYRNYTTIIPKASDEIEANDIVYFITTAAHLNFVKEQAGKTEHPISNIMFMGGSRIARKTILTLPTNYNLKLLEQNREKSFSLAGELENALVLNSDGRNIELLKDEGIESMDAFVAVTGNSEANILACLAAKKLGVKKTVAEVENNDYIKLAESLDIGTIINKKLIAASYIYQLTLNANVLNVKCLTASNADVLEFVVKAGSRITQSKIKDIKLPAHVNIGGIVRNGVGSIVDGNTQLLADDHVIVFCEASSIRKIETFFN